MDAPRLRLAVALAALLLAPSCIGFEWERDREMRWVPPEASARLSVGDDLSRCLDLLGAPAWLWEYRGDGLALAWGASEVRNLGFSVSVPITERASGSFNYNHVNEGFRGVLVTFDSDWRVESVATGYLRDLVAGLRQPPALVE